MDLYSIKKEIKKSSMIYMLFKKTIGFFDVSNYIKYIKNIDNKKDVLYEGAVLSRSNEIINSNLGDDLNKYLFEYITGKKFINIYFSKIIKPISHYVLIGSVLNYLILDNAIIYGSGVLDPEAPIIGAPKKIISVRGPKTRDVLLSKGINCPKNYGDPVLLISKFYRPKVNKKFKYGIIFNNGTRDLKVIKKVKDIFSNEIRIISMTEYDNWKYVIQEICECENIISESLHGLIISETYGIPNVWVDFINHAKYWDFKFMDFYYSIGKNKESIIHFRSENDVKKIKLQLEKWKKADIDYSNLLKHFPFEIRKKPL